MMKSTAYYWTQTSLFLLFLEAKKKVDNFVAVTPQKKKKKNLDSKEMLQHFPKQLTYKQISFKNIHTTSSSL